ncbi:MAG: hypothetical protein Roseis2KO_57830 [Roseivirga sp.]
MAPVIVMFATSALGQSTIDSLSARLEQVTDSVQLMMTYQALGNEYFDKGNDHEALNNYEKYLAIGLAKGDTTNILSGYYNVIQPLIYLELLPRHLETAQAGLAAAYQYEVPKFKAIFSNEIGVVYRKMGYGDSALHYLNIALDVSIAMNNKNYESFILENLGNTQSNQGDFAGALRSYLAAQKIYESTDQKDDLMDLEYNIGVLYKKIGEYEKALDSYMLALGYYVSTQDTTSTSGIYHNIASLYQIQGQLDSAMVYVRKSMQLDKYSDIQCTSGNAVLLGEIYMGLERYDSARIYFKQELLTLADCDSKFYYAPALSSLGDLALMEGNNSEALSYYTQSLAFAEENNYKEDIAKSAEGLYKVYQNTGDYQKSLTYYKLYQNTQDSLLNLDNTRRMAWMEANQQMEFLADSLEFERMMSESELNFQIARQKEQRTIIILISIVALVIIVVTTFFYQKRKKQRYREQLAKEREEGLQNVLLATEAERNRISKDLHDGVGQQLSAIKLAMSAIGSKAEGSTKTEIELLNEKFAQSADEVRAISHQMMPRALMENGLVEAIEDLLHSTFAYSDTQYKFEHTHMKQRFDQRIEISVYRVLQELINNVIKHANASLVTIQLYKLKEQLILLVEDDGKGMKTNKGRGHGLHNIESRLSIVNGKVNFESGQGTTAIVSVPIE